MEHLSAAARLTKENARSVEEMYELYPKLKELRKSRAANLSGGEQQMLAVAREIAHWFVSEGVTVLLTQQSVDFSFDMAEQGHIFDTGEIVYEGTVEEICSREDLLETYLTMESTDV